jgi:hypothetical protein
MDLGPIGGGSTPSGSGYKPPPSPLRWQWQCGARHKRSSSCTPHPSPLRRWQWHGSRPERSGSGDIFFFFFVSKNGTFRQPVEAHERYISFIGADRKYTFFSSNFHRLMKVTFVLMKQANFRRFWSFLLLLWPTKVIHFAVVVMPQKPVICLRADPFC